MNGLKKAALFLSSLAPIEADQLLSRLDGESARLIRREIMSLRQHNLSAEDSHRLDEEFLYSAGWQPVQRIREHQFVTPQPTTYGLPKRPAGQSSKAKYTAAAFVPPVRSFEFMRNWAASDVVNAIIDEHPQAIAVVLAHLPKSKMKSVLSALPHELQWEVQRRLDVYEMPEAQIVQEIESALRVRYRNQHRIPKRSPMLESFDDMETLSDLKLSTLFRSVDLTTAMLSLIGMEPALVGRVTKSFSPTEEYEMRKRLKRLGSFSKEEIEQARQDVLEQYNATLG